MSNKESNEVTIKIICNKEKLINILEDNGFYKGREFLLDDYYFIPNNIDIEKLSTRDILAKAVIIRYIIDDGERSFKKLLLKRRI